MSSLRFTTQNSTSEEVMLASIVFARNNATLPLVKSAFCIAPEDANKPQVFFSRKTTEQTIYDNEGNKGTRHVLARRVHVYNPTLFIKKDGMVDLCAKEKTLFNTNPTEGYHPYELIPNSGEKDAQLPVITIETYTELDGGITWLNDVRTEKVYQYKRISPEEMARLVRSKHGSVSNYYNDPEFSRMVNAGKKDDESMFGQRVISFFLFSAAQEVADYFRENDLPFVPRGYPDPFSANLLPDLAQMHPSINDVRRYATLVNLANLSASMAKQPLVHSQDEVDIIAAKERALCRSAILNFVER